MKPKMPFQVVRADIVTLSIQLTAHGYGAPAERIAQILQKLDDEERRDLLYVCKRAAEKLGPPAFCVDPA